MENRAVSAWQGCREASHSIFPQEAQEMFGMVRNCRAAGQFSAWRRWHLAIGILASLMVSSCAPEQAQLSRPRGRQVLQLSPPVLQRPSRLAHPLLTQRGKSWHAL